MAFYQPYTGMRVSPVPSGYLGAAATHAASVQKGYESAGDSIGKAIEGYGRQKKEEKRRLEKIAALAQMYSQGDAEASMLDPNALRAAAEEDAMANFNAKRKRAEDKAMSLYEVGQVRKHDEPWIKERGQFADSLSQSAERLRPEAEAEAANAIKKIDSLRSRADDLTYDKKRKRLTRDQLDEINRLRKNGQQQEADELLYDKSRKRLTSAQLDQINSLRQQADALEKSPGPISEKIKSLTGDAAALRTEAAEWEQNLVKREADVIERFRAAESQPPISAAIDAVRAEPWKHSSVQVTEEGGLEEELANRIGPKLLKKMTSGDMNKGEELLLIDVLENYHNEQREARTPKGQLTQMQLNQLQGKVGREQQVGETFDAISRLPTTRMESGRAMVTPENLMGAVQRGEMTAAEAMQREEAMVDHINRLGVSPQAGLPPLPAGVEGLVLRPPSAQHDYTNPNAYKINKAFQGDYGSLSDAEQRKIWEAEKGDYTLDVPTAQTAPAAPAPPMEMMQQFESEVQIPAAEQKQRAMDLLNRKGIRPGTAEYNDAVTEINRRYPSPLGAGYRVGQRTVSPSGSVTDVITPAPVSQYAKVPGADGRYQLWVDGKPHGDPISFDNEYLSLAPELQKVSEEMRMQILRDPSVKTYMESAAYAKSVKRLVAKMDNGKPSGIDTGKYTASDDVALVFQFMKALDPTSVVRESEYATAQNTGGIPHAVWNLFNKAKDGEFLTPGQRMNFAGTVETVSEGYRESALVVVDEFETQAARRKIPTKFVVPDMFKADYGKNARTPSRYGPPPAFIRGKGGKLQPAPRE